ncbi:hypothetical protein [Robertmurraya sp. FSL R5-0851]|uniref:hypothetical protein n=1 Tax=Robertmurraya sp. FSL R5-0851 TaxID=2921584 RepID=UPI0030F81063
MADKTWGVKISDEYFDKVESLFGASDEASKKAWFEKLIALAEAHSVKEDAIEYRQDLNELEVHTRRIYELITNMVQRSVVLRESSVREVTEKLEKKEAVIVQYQEKNRAATEELKQAQELIEGLEKVYDEMHLSL